ncbi:MAG: pseudouridine synthase [Alistipes senegalensis]|nr:pseudouridine synthase [Bacteroides cellulosilyticus]MCM1352060.1 pseudouridine synthase [Alistipes senegalensis]
MKDPKNDSTPALARFGRDKRTRTVTATSERVERRPRQPREAADAEHPREYKRASYNPNFTHENRPTFDEKPRRSQRNYGERPNYDEQRPRSYSERSSYKEKPHGYRAEKSGQEERRPYGNRSEYRDKPYRSFGSKPRYGDNKPQHNYGNDSENMFGNERPRRPYGSKPTRPSFNGRTDEDRNFNSDRRFEKRTDNRGSKKFGNKFGKPTKPGFKKRDEQPVSYPKYNPEKQTGAIRLNRFIAQSGICSRREADDFIVAGVVTVNGKAVTELGTKVMPTDEIRFNDSRVQGEKNVYLVLNKPKGYVTSLDDPHATKTVMDLVKGACEERIYPVGRLDKNSLGLLLFTNDGNMTKQLTHPAYQKKKIYQVTLDKPLTKADMERIAEGITLEDGEIHADEIAYVKDKKQEIGIEIHSGRNRIVRRIFEHLGYEVKKLDRVYYAGLTKKKLKRGAWRFLTDEEVQRLKSGQYE